MSNTLTRAEVERIAALAHLELTEDEKELFTRQLADILAYARLMEKIDTKGVTPTSHVLASHPAFRPDGLPMANGLLSRGGGLVTRRTSIM